MNVWQEVKKKKSFSSDTFRYEECDWVTGALQAGELRDDDLANMDDFCPNSPFMTFKCVDRFDKLKKKTNFAHLERKFGTTF